MMKKNGFTLAEVLITLAIIGVVATLTLPSLLSNTAEQQAVTAFRKAMNTLNEAAQMNVALDGFDFTGIQNDTDNAGNGTNVYTEGVLNQNLWALLVTKTQVNIAESNTSPIGGECNGGTQAILRDGTAICWAAYEAPAGNFNAQIQVIVDTNGKKGPNLISQCQDATCTTGKQINDQFRVTLHGTTAEPGWNTYNNGQITEGAQPEDNAARWAMSK